jgi:hypothetical protein
LVRGKRCASRIPLEEKHLVLGGDGVVGQLHARDDRVLVGRVRVVEKERVVTRVILGVVLEPVNKDDEQLGPGAASPGDAGTGWG